MSRFGNALVKLGMAFGGLDAGNSSRMRKDLGWSRDQPESEDAIVNPSNLEATRLKANNLRRNNPAVAGFCERLATWIVSTGIVPQARTSSRDWNTASETFWNGNFAFNCDTRKRATLNDLCRLAISLRPTHGGIYFQLTPEGRFRPIETERIRNPKNPNDAKAYTNGVRVDPSTGMIVDYCAHSRDESGRFSQQSAEQRIPAASMLPVITPTWRPDQVREEPDLCSVVNILQDIGEMSEFTLATAKAQSQIIAALKKNGGMGMAGLPKGSTAPSAGQRNTFKVDWGQIYELWANEDLDLKAPASPGNMHIPFMKYSYAIAGTALGFPYEFLTLDLSTLDFSRQKGLLLLVDHACRPWKKWIVEKFLTPAWNWRIAMAMQRGEIPRAPVVNGVSEWSKIEWQFPKTPWSDRQEAMQADMMEIQSGLKSLSMAAKERSVELEDVLEDKAKDWKLVNEIAKRHGISPEQLVKLQIPGQTGAIPKEQAQPEPKPTPTKPPADEPDGDDKE